MSRENMHGEGHVLLQVLRDGVEIQRREGRNMVVQNGMKLLAKRIWADTTPKKVQFMQLGKNGTAATTAQVAILTALTVQATPVHLARQTVASITMSGARIAKWEHTWTATEFSASGLEEVALFNQKTLAAGTMFARYVFTTVNKTKSDTLKITWTLKIS